MNPKVKQDLLRYLFEKFEWVNLSKIERETRIEIGKLKNYLKDLQDEGLVEKKWSSEYYYRLTDKGIFEELL